MFLLCRKLFFQDFNTGQLYEFNLDSKVTRSIDHNEIYALAVDVHRKTLYGKYGPSLVGIDYNGKTKFDFNTKKANIEYLTAGIDGEVFYSQSLKDKTEVYSFTEGSTKTLFDCYDKVRILY